MFEDALRYPTSSDDGVVRILLAGLMIVFGWLILPGLVLFGYVLRVLDRSSRGDEELPPFDDWGELAVDGLRGLAVTMLVSLVLWLLLVLPLFALGIGSEMGRGSLGAFAGLSLLMVFVVGVLGIVVQYVIPAALTNMAREGHIGAAFDLGALRPVLFSESYVLAMGLMIVVSTVGGFVFAFFGLLTLGLGYLLGPFFYAWLYLVGAYMFGRAFGEAVEDRGDGATVDEAGDAAAT